MASSLENLTYIPKIGQILHKWHQQHQRTMTRPSLMQHPQLLPHNHRKHFPKISHQVTYLVCSLIRIRSWISFVHYPEYSLKWVKLQGFFFSFFLVCWLRPWVPLEFVQLSRSTLISSTWLSRRARVFLKGSRGARWSLSFLYLVITPPVMDRS